MAYQKGWGSVIHFEKFGGGYQILYIARKVRIGKIALALTKARKVETEYTETGQGQDPTDVVQRHKILVAGKAMGEQRKIMGFLIKRQIEISHQSLVFSVFKFYFVP